MKAMCAILGAAVVMAPLSSSLAAGQKFKSTQANGAIAYHRASGSYGYTTDRSSTREAKTEALRQCAHAKCEVVASFRNACGAVANGPKRFAATSGTTRQEAESKALRKCGDGCDVAVWACTK
jgi:serine/threonine-protein kinase